MGGTFRSRIVTQGVNGNTLSLDSYIYGIDKTKPPTDYDAMQTEQGGNNPTEYRTKELFHSSQMGRSGRLQLGQPGARQQWLHSRDHTNIERKETENGYAHDVASIDTVIDGDLAHEILGQRASNAHVVRVRTQMRETTIAPRAVTIAAPTVLTLPPVW